MIDAALLRKYSTPAPRYTSYPTVPFWQQRPDSEEWLSQLRQCLNMQEQQSAGAALYVHIPFCEQLCTFCGCNTRITKNHEVAGPYIQHVLKEWSLYREQLTGSELVVADLHLGGGTPTFFRPEELRSLVKGVMQNVARANEAEFSLEVDPRVTTVEHLDVLRDLGFTRLSIGVQDLDPQVQQTVNRVNSVEVISSLTTTARQLGFTCINYDLIYGLPHQTERTLEQTFDKVLKLQPERIAFYPYAHVPWIKPSHRKYSEANLPSAEQKRALHDLGRELMYDQGYVEIGMDHFAAQDDALYRAMEAGTLHRNFMGYAAQLAAPLIGLGVSAIGDSWGMYAQNEKVLEKYYKRVNAGQLPLLRGHALTDEDKVIRRHILNLLTCDETDWQAAERFTDFLQQVPKRLAELAADGLVETSEHHVRVLEVGRPFMRNIAMAFDARLARKAPDLPLFRKL